MQWLSFIFGFPQTPEPKSSSRLLRLFISPLPSHLSETRHVLASVKAKEIAQARRERRGGGGKCEKRRTPKPKADDSRNFDAVDDAVILANTNTNTIYPEE